VRTAVKVSQKRKAELSHLSICNTVFQQLFEVLIPILILVTCLPSLGRRSTVENKNMEEGVEEENGKTDWGSTSNVYDIRVG
jgi:hypothetical protein